MTHISAVLVLLALGATANAEAPLQEVEKSGIEYSSPKDAYEALSKKQGVSIRTEANGWVVASEQNAHVIWSFAPNSDPSFPSVVKRTLVESNGAISIEMAVKCGGSKEACDNLVRQFLDLNEKIKQEVKKASKAKK